MSTSTACRGSVESCKENCTMWKDAILAYLHFAAIFTLLWFLVKEWALLKVGVEQLEVKRLANADIGYFIAAIAVLATGLSRLLFGAKPVIFYTGNPVFHVKVGLFVLVAIISIWPTLAFIRWRKAAAANAAFRVDQREWRMAKRLLLVELHLVALIPLFAVLMARGIGYQG
jgi:putative membrane protein